MKYTISVAGGEEIEVDSMQFGMGKGSPEGNIELFVCVTDLEEDIYTESGKKNLWTGWIDKCCMDKHNPNERIRKVVAKVYGGDGDDTLYRTVTIENACITSFRESSMGTHFEMEVVIKRAPRKAGEISVAAG